MARKPTKLTTPADENLLSPETKQALQAKARERVAKERRDRAEDAYLEHAVEAERRANDPVYEIKRIRIDLAGHADRIRLDDVIFLHGFDYDVTLPVYATLKDIMARTWEHEDEVGGVNRDQYRRPRSTILRPGMENMTVTTGRLLGGL